MKSIDASSAMKLASKSKLTKTNLFDIIQSVKGETND